jgi:hypothetical protein
VDEQTITAGLLRKLMSGISEDYWCAGWLSGLEYTLWDAVTGKRKNVCSSEEIEQLKYLSEKSGGWIIWDEQAKDEDSYRWRTGCACTMQDAILKAFSLHRTLGDSEN